MDKILKLRFILKAVNFMGYWLNEPLGNTVC